MRPLKYIELNFPDKRRILYLSGNYPGKIKHIINLTRWYLRDLKIHLKSRLLFKIFSNKKDNKKYREDLNLWEERKLILLLIPFYKYSIWKDGKTRTQYSFLKKRKTSAKYLKCTELPLVSVDAKEFQEKYQNNKWLIPINKKLKLE